MAQLAVVSATVLAGASDQAVPHTLDRTPTVVIIVEKDEAEIKADVEARCYAPAGTAIGTTKTKVKTVNAVEYSVGNSLFAKAATDDFWTLTGFDCTNALFNKCLLCIDTAGAMQIGAGTEAATAAAVVLPDTPANSCVVAVLQVNPTGTGNFVGGTTDLDDGTVVPNAAYTDVGGHPDGFPEVTEGSAPDATNVYVNNSMQRDRDVQIFCFAPHSIIA